MHSPICVYYSVWFFISAKVNVVNIGGYDVFTVFVMSVHISDSACYCDSRQGAAAMYRRLGVTSQEVSLFAMSFIFSGPTLGSPLLPWQ